MVKKIFKILTKVVFALVLVAGAVKSIQILEPSQPTFASMGSTGGGSTGGGYSGGGGYSSTSDSDDDSDSDPFISLIVIILVVIYVVGSVIIKRIYFKLHFGWRYQSWNLKYNSILIESNLSLNTFEKSMRAKETKLKPVQNNDDYNEFSEVYIKAQYLYSQDIRERYVNKHYSLRNLLEYLDSIYYRVMKKEIKLKVSESTIDDTIVSEANIVSVAKLSNNIWITRIDAVGKDKEVQFNKDFNDSFTRSKWSDYVVFGRDRKDKIKIINLIYGEHFHLNGKDFNKQKSLGKGDYKEKKL